MKNNKIWDCIVVGSGSAGLSCATALAKKNKSVLVLEKSPFLGGRTSSAFNKQADTVFDNGQHILMGCYEETQRYLKRINTLDGVQFFKEERILLKGQEKEGVFKIGSFKPPWNFAWAFLNFKAVPFFDRLKALKVGRSLKDLKLESLKNKTAKQWLKDFDQSDVLLDRFWQPLCLATLNQPIETASSAELAAVLRRTFLNSDPAASSIGFVNKGLTDVFATPAKQFIEANGGSVLSRAAVVSFYKNRQKIYEVETEKDIFYSKKIVLALPPDQLYFLARESRIKMLIDSLRYITNLKPSPIVTIYLKFKEPQTKHMFFGKDATKPAKMVGFWNSKVHWMFDRPAFFQNKKEQDDGYICFIASAADYWADKKPSHIFSDLCKDMDKLYNIDFKSLVEHYTIRKEAKATWVLKNLRYKTNVKEKTYDPDLFLCGDWLDVELPSTIEAAMRSGHRVAQHIYRHKQ